jgi:cystathionine beta-lyase
MKYNFDEIVSRRGTHSIKWDAAKKDEVLPMWIADMDFNTFPAVSEALMRTAEKGHFGYNTVPDDFYDAIILWWRKRHQLTIQKEWILPSTGVVAGIAAIITTLVSPGDEVIVQTPAYNHFFNVIDACRCTTVANALIYEDGTYRIDFEDLERKAASEKARILLLCSPHNPVGRAWTEQELEQVASICARHNIFVISDEIHSDLIFQGRTHIPFISLAIKHDLPSVTCTSGSKTFNLSGLHAAYIFASDSNLRKTIMKQLYAQGAGTPSLIACEALRVSYNEGDVWLTELNAYLYENYQFLLAFIAEHISAVRVIPLEATYLVWLDCSGLKMRSVELAKSLLEKENLWVNAGDMYGASGEGFLRLNIACPREVLKEGLSRLANLIGDYHHKKEF